MRQDFKDLSKKDKFSNNMNRKDQHKLNNLLMATHAGITRLQRYILEREDCYDLIDQTVLLKKAADDLLNLFEDIKNGNSSR